MIAPTAAGVVVVAGGSVPVVGGAAIVVGGPVTVVPVKAVVGAAVATGAGGGGGGGGGGLPISATLTTGPPRSGRGMLLAGVPGAASTVSVTCLPPTNVTSRRRGSAVAGPEMTVRSSSEIPRISAAMRNELLLIRLFQLLPHGRRRGSVVEPPRRRSAWKLPSDL